MEVIPSRRTSAATTKTFGRSLSLYKQPPSEQITLEDFEVFAFDRLQVLREIEQLRVNGFTGKQFAAKVMELSDKHIPTRGDDRKDIISHFILRLAYCPSEELRRWFMNQECSLFKARFESLSPEHRRQFVEANNLGFEAVSGNDDEIQEILGSLMPETAQDVFKVPFDQVLDLVANRRVALKDGFAYVLFQDMVSLVAAQFRNMLSKALVVAHKALPHVIADERLLRLKNFATATVGADLKKGNIVSGQVTPADIDKLSVRSMPLCMRNLHQKLRQNHHLKHDGRQQYGLFLKGIGLTLQHALDFWRSEFSKGGVTPEKFDKQYAYNIRHNYGKEGKRADYTPLPCGRIIKSAVGSDDTHGCPFKHFTEDMLKATMSVAGTPSSTQSEIVSLVGGMHYQIACKRFYESQHPGSELSVVHPNKYFDESMAYYAEKNGDVKVESVKLERAANVKVEASS